MNRLVVIALLLFSGCHAVTRQIMKVQASSPATKTANGVVTASYEIEVK